MWSLRQIQDMRNGGIARGDSSQVLRKSLFNMLEQITRDQDIYQILSYRLINAGTSSKNFVVPTSVHFVLRLPPEETVDQAHEVNKFHEHLRYWNQRRARKSALSQHLAMEIAYLPPIDYDSAARKVELLLNNPTAAQLFSKWNSTVQHRELCSHNDFLISILETDQLELNALTEAFELQGSQWGVLSNNVPPGKIFVFTMNNVMIRLRRILKISEVNTLATFLRTGGDFVNWFATKRISRYPALAEKLRPPRKTIFERLIWSHVTEVEPKEVTVEWLSFVKHSEMKHKKRQERWSKLGGLLTQDPLLIDEDIWVERLNSHPELCEASATLK